MQPPHFTDLRALRESWGRRGRFLVPFLGNVSVVCGIKWFAEVTDQAAKNHGLEQMHAPDGKALEKVAHHFETRNKPVWRLTLRLYVLN